MKSSLKLVLLSLIVLGLQWNAIAQTNPQGAKNVLLIVSDDLNDNLSCYGHPIVKTPHIDRLAKMGVKFDNAQAQFTTCNPSRTSFMSGLYPNATGIVSNAINSWETMGHWTMMQECFKNGGYFTARCNKIFHNKNTTYYPWDIDLSHSKSYIGKTPLLASGGSDGEVWSWQVTNQTDESTEDGSTVRYLSQVIDDHVNGRDAWKGKPFFVAVGLKRPHTPWRAQKKHFDKYFNAYPPSVVSHVKLPLELGEPIADRKDIPAIAISPFADYKLLTDTQRREHIAGYYASIAQMDESVGVMLATMDRLDLWKNTVVVFMGDHGYHLGEHGGLARKMTLYEESTRVPFIIAAPGVNAGVCQRPVGLIDLYTTLTALCGVTPPVGLQGQSIKPLLSNPSLAWNRPAFSTILRKNALAHSIRTERYRYTEWPDGSKELYDIVSDPNQYVNLVSPVNKLPQDATLLATLKKQLDEATARAYVKPKFNL